MNGTRSPFQRAQRRREDGYRVVRNTSEQGTSAEIFVYEEIGAGWFGGLTAKQFTEDLQALDVDTINLHINSPGGSVFEGTTIFNALKQHRAQVITHVDGLAASIASIIALAGDEVRMAENAFMMIHDPWTVSMGDAAALRKDAAILDKIGVMLVQTYVNVSHKDAAIIKDWMSAETWFTADEAVAAGLATSVTKASDTSASVFDLSAFARVPEKLQQPNAPNAKLGARDVEQALRDVGFSQSQAKAITAKGASALRDQRDAGTQEFLEQSRQLVATIKSSFTRK
jgi:ATP-dependent Clp protease protease subunit